MKNILNEIMLGGCVHCKYLLLGWTAAVCISLGWNVYMLHNQVIEQARVEARTIFSHNLAYRKWNTRHGGVYVKLDDESKPNPYLVTEDRDLAAENGIRLTLVNPFQMTREAYQLLHDETEAPIFNRTVSTGFLNPANKPDAWEKKALDAFFKGTDEVSEITAMDDESYMRLIRPYITSKGCLKCHGFQGYDIGDIRGGMSISIPMKPYFAQEAVSRRATLLTHLVLWLFGMGSITLLTRNIQKHQIKISESEKKFRILAESATDWEYWVSDQEGIVFMSPSCVEITGYTRQEFEDNHQLIFQIIHNEDRGKYLKNASRQSEDKAKAIEIRITAKDGSIKWLSHAWRPIYINNTIMGKRVSNRDITAQKELESQLYHAQRMEAIGSLSGGIAHDFNNILTAILGHSLLSLRQLPDQSPLRKNIEAICLAGEKAAALTRQLLAFSRKQVLQVQPVRVNALVSEMQEMISRLIGGDIDLKIRLDPEEFPVLADRSQLDQVILNLAVNARDAMPEGGVLTIEAKGLLVDNSSLQDYPDARTGAYMQLRVTDTGHGIPREIIDKIFEPFYTTKAPGKGTGLGLATVYGIVKQHDGYIYVSSEQGCGTCFTVLLPVADVQLNEEHKPENVVMAGGVETILVVDNESAICDLVADILEPLGYTLITASCASEAIKLTVSGQKRIDLLLTDVVMPGMNGRELADSLKGMSPATKLIFMSGNADNVITREGLQKPGVHFIGKPFTPHGLAKKIRTVLDS